MKIKKHRKAPGVTTYLIDSGTPYLRITALDADWWARYQNADVIDPATGEVLAAAPGAR